MSAGRGAGKPAPVERARARAVVTGLVQGVSFRACARAEAEKLGVSGWVKNRSDGSVEVLAEGPRAAVERLLAWCRRGPTFARVDEVRVAWEEPAGEFTRFEVEHGW
ncbi:MAG: acylphosphatase [Thermoanaerobaculia bacterium]